MSAEEHQAILQEMADSVARAVAEAEGALRVAEAADCIRLVDLALRGVHVVRWIVPGPAMPICDQCGRTDQWYQWVRTGCVRCGCTITG